MASCNRAGCISSERLDASGIVGYLSINRQGLLIHFPLLWPIGVDSSTVRISNGTGSLSLVERDRKSKAFRRLGCKGILGALARSTRVRSGMAASGSPFSNMPGLSHSGTDLITPPKRFSLALASNSLSPPSVC